VAAGLVGQQTFSADPSYFLFFRFLLFRRRLDPYLIEMDDLVAVVRTLAVVNQLDVLLTAYLIEMDDLVMAVRI
jgi:hypothetical protein